MSKIAYSIKSLLLKKLANYKISKYLKNGVPSGKTTINLTSNIISTNLPEPFSQNIAILLVEDPLQGELTCKYDGKEFKRKIQFIGPR